MLEKRNTATGLMVPIIEIKDKDGKSVFSWNYHLPIGKNKKHYKVKYIAF